MYNDNLNIDLSGTPRQSLHVSQLSNTLPFDDRPLPGSGQFYQVPLVPYVPAVVPLIQEPIASVLGENAMEIQMTRNENDTRRLLADGINGVKQENWQLKQGIYQRDQQIAQLLRRLSTLENTVQNLVNDQSVITSSLDNDFIIDPTQNNQHSLRGLDSISNAGSIAHGSVPPVMYPSVTANQGVHFNLGGLSHGGQHANLNTIHMPQHQESAAHGGINNSVQAKVPNPSITLRSGKIVSVEDEYIIRTSIPISDPATLALMKSSDKAKIPTLTLSEIQNWDSEKALLWLKSFVHYKNVRGMSSLSEYLNVEVLKTLAVTLTHDCLVTVNDILEMDSQVLVFKLLIYFYRAPSDDTNRIHSKLENNKLKNDGNLVQMVLNNWWVVVLQIVGEIKYQKHLAKVIIKSILNKAWKDVLESHVDTFTSWIDIKNQLQPLIEKYDESIRFLKNNNLEITRKNTSNNENPKTKQIGKSSAIIEKPTPIVEKEEIVTNNKKSSVKCDYCGGSHWAMNSEGTVWQCDAAITDEKKKEALMAAKVIKYAKTKLKLNTQKGKAKQVSTNSTNFFHPVLEALFNLQGCPEALVVGLDTQSSSSLLPLSLYNEFFRSEELLSIPPNCVLLDAQGKEIPMVGLVLLKVENVRTIDKQIVSFNAGIISFVVTTSVDSILISCLDISKHKLDIMKSAEMFYHSSSNKTTTISQVISIPDDKFEVLKSLHNNQKGHVGINRLYAMAKKEFPELSFKFAEVQQFIKLCPFCQKSKTNTYAVAPFSLQKGLVHQIYFDIFFANGLFFLVVLYPMTDYLQVEEVSSLSAQDTVIGLVKIQARINFDHVIGNPDLGTNFESALTKALFEMVDGTLLYGIAQDHQSHAFIETSNKIVKGHMKPIISVLQLRFPSKEATTMAMFISTTIHNNLGRLSLGGHSPNELTNPLMSGCLQLLNAKPDAPPLIQQIAEIQEAMLRTVLQQQAKYMQKHQLGAAHGPSTDSIQAGTLVLITHDAGEQLGKFSFAAMGPYEVMTISDDKHILKVKHVQDPGKTMDIHAARCMPFFHDPRWGYSITDISGMDSSSTTVLSVLNHIGNPAKRKEMQFEIQWADGSSSWLDWSEVRDLEAVDIYIETHPSLNRLKNKSKKEKGIVARIEWKPVHNDSYLNKEVGISVADLANNLKDVTVGGTPEEQAAIRAILVRYAQVFEPIGSEDFSSFPPHKAILIPDADPNSFYQAQYPIHNPKMFDEIAKVQDALLASGRLKKAPNSAGSQQLFNSSVFAVPKDDGSARGVTDLRHINKNIVTIPIMDPPDQEDIVRSAQKKYLMQTDQQQAFHQMRLHPDSQAIFSVRHVKTGDTLLPASLTMGYKNAPGLVQAYNEQIYHKPGEKVYCDNISGADNSFPVFLDIVEDVFKVSAENNIKLNARKTFINVPDQSMMGRKVNNEFRTIDDKSYERIMNVPLPRTQSELATVLGFLNWVRDYTLNFGTLAAPLHAMKSQIGKKLVWNAEQLEAWRILIGAASNPIKLYKMDPTKEVLTIGDASGKLGWAFYLYQYIGEMTIDPPVSLILDHTNPNFDLFRIIAMCTGSWDSTQRGWKTIDQECYAFYRGMIQNANLLYGRKFILFTDHDNLTYLSSRSASDKVNRWRVALQEFEFDAIHTPGERNTLADDTSRLGVPEVSTTTVSSSDAIISRIEG